MQTLLARAIGILGKPPLHILQGGRETAKYFTHDYMAFQSEPDGGYSLFEPYPTTLKEWLNADDDEFVDFLKLLLQWDPALRPTAEEALSHPFLYIHEGNRPRRCYFLKFIPSNKTTTSFTFICTIQMKLVLSLIVHLIKINGQKVSRRRFITAED